VSGDPSGAVERHSESVCGDLSAPGLPSRAVSRLGMPFGLTTPGGQPVRLLGDPADVSRGVPQLCRSDALRSIRCSLDKNAVKCPGAGDRGISHFSGVSYYGHQRGGAGSWLTQKAAPIDPRLSSRPKSLPAESGFSGAAPKKISGRPRGESTDVLAHLVYADGYCHAEPKCSSSSGRRKPNANSRHSPHSE
jgi:hypothetical protein